MAEVLRSIHSSSSLELAGNCTRSDGLHDYHSRSQQKVQMAGIGHNFRLEVAGNAAQTWARMDPSIYAQCLGVLGMVLTFGLRSAPLLFTATEPEKHKGPATIIGFLGMELDTEALGIRLPQANAELAAWRGRKACKKRELLSLIGSLSHTCKASESWSLLLEEADRLGHYNQVTQSLGTDL